MLDRTDKAAKPPKTDNWSALENERQGETVMLLVSGIVEVGSTNMEPRLSEASDDGGATLNLDLTIETADHEGADVLVWKQRISASGSETTSTATCTSAGPAMSSAAAR